MQNFVLVTMIILLLHWMVANLQFVSWFTNGGERIESVTIVNGMYTHEIDMHKTQKKYLFTTRSHFTLRNSILLKLLKQAHRFSFRGNETKQKQIEFALSALHTSS